MLDNSALSELLARSAREAEGHRERALRRASRSALVWRDEAYELLEQGRSLEELHGVGPNIARRIHDWLESPPADLDPPEERKDFLTLAAALKTLEAAPERLHDLRGDLQMHTVASDGKHTLSELTAALDERGYEYAAITDHSAGQRVPRGLPAEAILEQNRAIDEMNAALEEAGSSLRLLRSLEMNLTPAGEGDTDPQVLETLDLVLGSFHSNLRTPDDQTDRYIAALENPHVHVIGHPRTRKYDDRPGLAAEWDKVFETATALGKALEINASPDRQDLNVALLEKAREAGTMLTIGTDSHYEHELDYIPIAAAAAVRAGIPREQILNYRSRADILEWVHSHR